MLRSSKRLGTLCALILVVSLLSPVSLFAGSGFSKIREHSAQNQLPHSGEVYDGEMLDGKRHGYGTLQTPSGDVYIGEFKQGYIHGEGIYLWQQKGASYQGSFKKNKQSGQGVYTWPDGSSYKGTFEEGSFRGSGTFTVARTGKTYEGQWEKGYLLTNDIPEKYLCAITYHLLSKPIRLLHGTCECYIEKDILLEIAQKTRKDPFTQEPMSIANVEAMNIDKQLLDEIQQWLNDNAIHISDLW